MIILLMHLIRYNFSFTLWKFNQPEQVPHAGSKFAAEKCILFEDAFKLQQLYSPNFWKIFLWIQQINLQKCIILNQNF